MKPFSILLLIFLACIAFAADSFDYHCAGITLLTNKKVQAEVGVSTAQRAQMNKFADAHRARLTAYQKGLNGKQPDYKLLNGYVEDLKRNVLSVLSATQLKRLRELSLQAAGLSALTDRQVATRVGSTEAQLKAFTKTFATSREGVIKVMRSTLLPINEKYRKLATPYKGHEKEHQADIAKLRDQFNAEAKAAEQRVKPQVDMLTKQAEKKLLAMITPQQKAAWTALKGKIFQP